MITFPEPDTCNESTCNRLYVKPPFPLGGDLGTLMWPWLFTIDFRTAMKTPTWGEISDLKFPSTMLLVLFNEDFPAFVTILPPCCCACLAIGVSPTRHRISDNARSALTTLLLRPFFDLGVKNAFLLHSRNFL